ncbi:hypothetical protein C8R47DRAFT_1190143 [Mycena vitilis]|nr:hypothetical protein C8R47DRAFT_1190143 [Mycena vitilis]
MVAPKILERAAIGALQNPALLVSRFPSLPHEDWVRLVPVAVTDSDPPPDLADSDVTEPPPRAGLIEVFSDIGRTLVLLSLKVVASDYIASRPPGFSKALEACLLASDMLKKILARIDPRTIFNSVARVDGGFYAFVGGVWYRAKRNIVQVTSWLSVILEPLVEAIAIAYSANWTAPQARRSSTSHFSASHDVLLLTNLRDIQLSNARALGVGLDSVWDIQDYDILANVGTLLAMESPFAPGTLYWSGIETELPVLPEEAQSLPLPLQDLGYRHPASGRAEGSENRLPVDLAEFQVTIVQHEKIIWIDKSHRLLSRRMPPMQGPRAAPSRPTTVIIVILPVQRNGFDSMTDKYDIGRMLLCILYTTSFSITPFIKGRKYEPNAARCGTTSAQEKYWWKFRHTNVQWVRNPEAYSSLAGGITLAAYCMAPRRTEHTLRNQNSQTGSQDATRYRGLRLERSSSLAQVLRALAESGLIVEYLGDHFGPTLIPTKWKAGWEEMVGGETEAYLRHRFLMHYCEGSLMAVLLVSLFSHKIKTAHVPFLLRPIMSFISTKINHQPLVHRPRSHDSLRGSAPDGGPYLCANKLTGADIMMSFPVMLVMSEMWDRGPANLNESSFPRLFAYSEELKKGEGYKRAAEKIAALEGDLEDSEYSLV